MVKFDPLIKSWKSYSEISFYNRTRKASTLVLKTPHRELLVVTTNQHNIYAVESVYFPCQQFAIPFLNLVELTDSSAQMRCH